MTDLLRKTYNACDPQSPAKDDQYWDCSSARGQGAFTQWVKTHLELQDGHARFLFTGHLGCGKSSELAALHRELAKGPVGDRRYLPVMIPAGDYLDPYDADIIDILLAIMTELAAALRETYEIELKDSYLSKRLQELKGFLLSEVEIEKGDVPLLGAKLEIKRLRTKPEARKKVRDALEPKKSSLLEEINLALLEAKQAVTKRLEQTGKPPLRDFVVILDDLEKIRRFGGKNEGIESQRELFLERAAQLTSLETHVVYTIPLNLARSAATQLQQAYGVAPAVLPMVKVFHRGPARTACEEGRGCLRGLLSRRMSPYPVDDVFKPAASECLIEWCGGHVRQLLQFVREAIAYARGRGIARPLPLEVAQQAIRQSVGTYSTMIPESHWAKLVALERSPDQRIPNGDADYLQMLENLSVLEYVNGNGAPHSLEPWYAVHPIVRQLERFQREMKATEAKSSIVATANE